MKSKDKWIKVGEVGVDAGLIWIGDPCYILHKDGKDKKELEKSIGKDWGEFCKLISSKPTISFDYPLGHEGLGVCLAQFGGDGVFPVYVSYTDDGLIKEARIIFND